MNVKRISFLGIRARSAQGFTLIEILVASAVMALLVGLVITITSQVLNVWNRSGGRLSANQEARIAMELLTQDLETAIFRNRRSAADDSEWLRIVNAGFAPAPNTISLQLFSPALDRPDGPGDICAISYQLLEVDAVGSPASGNQFALFRQLNDPEVTFGTDADNSLLGKPIETWGQDISATDFLVSNIIEFNIRLFEADGTEIDTTTEFVFDGLPGTRIPAFADIKLRVLSSEGANILQSPAGVGNMDDIIREHSTTFIRRVSFMNRPF